MAADVRLKLVAAQHKRRLVELRSSIPGAAPVEGYVCGVGAEWVALVALAPDVFLDGVSAVRIDDVRTVRRPRNAAFARAALDLAGAWPPPRPVEDATVLDDTRSLLAWARQFALVSFHYERIDPRACRIGSVMELDRKRVTFMPINPQARWEDRLDTFRLKQVTRVDVGGRYEAALAAVAATHARIER